MSEVLGEGKYLSLKREGRWEYCERIPNQGAVVIIPVTDEGKLVLVEQPRAAVGTSVIELPAGLVGDTAEFSGEQLETAAERELLEETGYSAAQMEVVAHGYTTPGMSNEFITFFYASRLRKVDEGGGDETEDITVWEVPVDDVASFLREAEARGAAIDVKVHVGLHFCGGAPSFPHETMHIDIEPPSLPSRLDSPIGLPLHSDTMLSALDEMLPPLQGNGRIGLLGGTFNPPHVGHALLAHAMLATEDLDELWIIPVFEHPFGKDSAGFEERLELCKLAFAMLGNKVRVLPIERELPKPSYTVQTLSALHAVRPGIKPTLVIGSDIVPDLPRWREPEALPVLSRIVVVPRQGSPPIEPPTDLDVKIYRGFRLPKVSSTAIRKALQHGKFVDGLVDLRVLEFIRSNGLYR